MPAYLTFLGGSNDAEWWTGQRNQRASGSPSRMMRRAFVFRWPLAHSCSAALPIAFTPMPATAGGEAMADEEQVKRLQQGLVVDYIGAAAKTFHWPP